METRTTTDPIYVAYYTINTEYEEIIKGLVYGFQKFNLEFKIYPVESKGSWEENTQLKSSVLFLALSQFEGRPVVYLDADARIEQEPSLFNQLDCDIAFHMFRGTELLSGTLYFGNTEQSQKLVALWCYENASNIGQWDQKTLQNVVTNCDTLNWALLPEEYVYINDLGTKGMVPVIRHLQASRQTRWSVR